MKLSFRDLKQNKFTIEAEPSDLISTLKEKIAAEKGWEASTQKLIYSGKILQDANTVESYKIEERGFVVCMTTKPKVISTTAKAPSTPANATSSATPAAPAQPISQEPPAVITPTPSNMNIESSTAVEASTSPATGLAIGAERSAQIAELESMGFERTHIDAAMRAAFYNSERAVEYLLNGIPEDIRPGLNPSTASPSLSPSPSGSASVSAEPAGQHQNLFDAAAALMTGGGARGGATRSTTGGTAGGAGTAGLGNLDFLRNNPQFQQLRQVVQQQPHMLEPILQQVGAGNPQLAALIGDHSQQFLQLLSEDADSEAPLPPGASSVSVTEDERAAIERLCLLGFSRDLAIQAYFACEKNEELAANFLFDQPDDDEQ
ncbi:hypothetical protein K3495_g2327 [Podosphaera aphanis]|nr:hypothetical protein K3495_g2327 [Podosphaera aphanis]